MWSISKAKWLTTGRLLSSFKDGKITQPDDWPSQFLARRVWSSHFIYRSFLQECSRHIGCHEILAYRAMNPRRWISFPKESFMFTPPLFGTTTSLNFLQTLLQIFLIFLLQFRVGRSGINFVRLVFHFVKFILRPFIMNPDFISTVENFLHQLRRNEIHALAVPTTRSPGITVTPPIRTGTLMPVSLFEGTVSGAVREARGKQDSAGPGHRWRHPGNSQNRRHGPRIRRADGSALCWDAGLLHDERALRRSHAEFLGPRTPVPRRALVVIHCARRSQNANRQSWLDRSTRQARPRRNPKRKRSSPTPGARHRLFRTHSAVGQRTLLGPPLELGNAQ